MPLAEALVAARRQGKLLVPSEWPEPATIQAAMNVQAQTSSLLGVQHRGLKVAVGPQKQAVAAPMSDIRFDLQEFIGLFPAMRIEIECCFRLCADVTANPSQPHNRADVMAKIDATYLGIEIVGSRFADLQPLPFKLLLADVLGNVGYRIGPEVDLSDVEKAVGQRCRITLAGQEICDAPGSHPDKDPLLPLVEYANQPIDSLGGLKKGQIVTTGSLCGAIPISAPGRVIATLGALPPLIFDVV